MRINTEFAVLASAKAEGFTPLKVAAKAAGLTPEHIALLAHRGK